jgi:hypothetical protein
VTRTIVVFAFLAFTACSKSERDRPTPHDAAARRTSVDAGVKAPDAPPPADAPIAPDAQLAPDARPRRPAADAAPPPDATPATSKPARGERCGTGDACADGLTCLHYYGIAGTRGPRFSSCETPCKSAKECPAGTTCSVVADGPGQVCR